MAYKKSGGAVVEWADLGRRLKAANPQVFDQISDLVRDIVDSQELIASFDEQLVLRGRRPTKRYSA